MCHPGIMIMLAFICSGNLPFSVDDVTEMTKSCQICNECKPCFDSPEPTKLIKATQPIQRLNLDFKGPLPSNSNNKYILTIVDEYSRFPLQPLFKMSKLFPFTRHYARFCPFLEYMHKFIQIDVLLFWVLILKSTHMKKEWLPTVPHHITHKVMLSEKL